MGPWEGTLPASRAVNPTLTQEEQVQREERPHPPLVAQNRQVATVYLTQLHSLTSKPLCALSTTGSPQKMLS